MIREAVAQSRAYLTSPEAAASLAADPYWPKWDSPWWHVLALAEAGAGVPPEAVKALVAASATHYVTYFPRSAAELPPGKDMRHHVMCFCALGSLLSVAEGVATIEWADDFFARYQTKEGGWNCDEQSAKASVVSTVPVLEYLLGKPALTQREREMLDRGVQWLLSLKLLRSRRTNTLLNEAWLTPALPRFYEYDVLRGLRLIARWVERTGASVPREAVAEALACEPRATRPRPLLGHPSFPLCDALSRAEVAGPILSAEWARVRATLG